MSDVPAPLLSGKAIGLGSAGLMIMVMQFLLFNAMLDFASDLILVGIAYFAGRLSK